MRKLSRYPASDCDSPASLLSLAGDFWAAARGNPGELSVLSDAVAAAWRRVSRDAAELLATAAIQTTPDHRVIEWVKLTVNNDSDGDVANVARYGESPAFRFGAAGRFGERRNAAFPVRLSPCVTAAAVFNRQTTATLSLIRGVDFHVDEHNQILWLPANPFNDPRWSPRVAARGGLEIDLWLWMAEFDEHWLRRRHGYAVGVDSPSTANGREFTAAVYSALAAGTTPATLLSLFAAVYDAPLCRTDDEVVEYVGADRRGRIVITDKQVYRHGDGASPIVAVGDRLTAGDPITDAVTLSDFSAGPPADAVALCVGSDLLPPGVGGPLLAVNADIPVRFDV